MNNCSFQVTDNSDNIYFKTPKNDNILSTSGFKV